MFLMKNFLFSGLLLLVAVLYQRKHKKRSFVQCIIALMISNYRFSYFPSITPKMSVYSSFALITSLMFQKGTVLQPAAFFCAILHKPHNIILVPLVIITAKKTYSFCDIWMDRKRSLLFKTVFTFWISKMYFFYQVCY